MPEAFQDILSGSLPERPVENKSKPKDEKSYYSKIKKKMKGFLVEGLTAIEKERIAKYICRRYEEALPSHEKLCDRIDEYDEVWRMQRNSIVGDDGDMPNYRSPLSSVTLEVIHSNIMNVFFTPKDFARAIPTEENDIPKINDLSTFMNWSTKNELKIFENVDRLFHASEKNGENPYIVHWVKEYGIRIKRIPKKDPQDPDKNLYDPDTEQQMFEEVEEPELLYNAPKIEILSRKDYIQPPNAVMGKLPDYEFVRQRMTLDDYLREQMQGKMFDDTAKAIKAWSTAVSLAQTESMMDYDGEAIVLGEFEQEFLQFYGRMRINTVKTAKSEDGKEVIDAEELEDEFIAIVHYKSGVLCQLRKNKFPLKMRPVGMDYFIPDDEGRRCGIGVIEFMDGPQSCYDILFNQYVFGVSQASNPPLAFDPSGNMRDKETKIRGGYAYPLLNLKSIGVQNPDSGIRQLLELITYWSQLLFGISEYAAGIESSIDPSAPAKKAEIVVAQGNVRLNTIIKRKNQTIKDILLRWFLLYRDNMPKNKFARIAGENEKEFEFSNVSIETFELEGLPDFELTGNILNVNKALEINKAIQVYSLLSKSPFFSPQTSQGLQSLHALTKWTIDKLDETGLSRFLPSVPGQNVKTPEEENALFLQGDSGEPTEGEPHMDHIRKHLMLVMDEGVPVDIRQRAWEHVNKHYDLMKRDIAKEIVFSQQGGQGLGGPSANNQPPDFQRGGLDGLNAGQQGGTPTPEVAGVL